MSSAARYTPHYTIDDDRLWKGDWELWHGTAVAMTPSPSLIVAPGTSWIPDWERSRRRRRSGWMSPILSRIGVDATGWCDVVARFGRAFKRAAGTPESLAKEAPQRAALAVCARESVRHVNGSAKTDSLTRI